jgi:DNA-binding MarR family transcriptional regulator
MSTGASEERRWRLFAALFGRVERELEAGLLRHHGLGLSEYRALSELAGAVAGELRMQELADALGLNQRSVSRLIGRLEAAGLTRRERCPNDRRGVYTAITERGHDRWRDAEPSYAQALTRALDHAATNRDLAAVLHALRA